MRKEYIKPSFRPIRLKQHILTLGSQHNVGLHLGERGKFDAKSCSFDACEDEYSDQ